MNAPGRKMLLAASIIMIALCVLTAGYTVFTCALHFSFFALVPLIFTAFVLTAAIIGIKDSGNASRYRTGFVCGIVLTNVGLFQSGSIWAVFMESGLAILPIHMYDLLSMLVIAPIYTFGASKNGMASRAGAAGQEEKPSENGDAAPNAPGKRLLLVTGIIMIAGFIVSLPTLFGMVYGSLPSLTAGEGIGLFALASALGLSPAAGIIGIRNRADISKYKVSFICGIILIVINAVISAFVCLMLFVLDGWFETPVMALMILYLVLLVNACIHTFGANKNGMACRAGADGQEDLASCGERYVSQGGNGQ